MGKGRRSALPPPTAVGMMDPTAEAALSPVITVGWPVGVGSESALGSKPVWLPASGLCNLEQVNLYLHLYNGTAGAGWGDWGSEGVPRVEGSAWCQAW